MQMNVLFKLYLKKCARTVTQKHVCDIAASKHSSAPAKTLEFYNDKKTLILTDRPAMYTQTTEAQEEKTWWLN